MANDYALLIGINTYDGTAPTMGVNMYSGHELPPLRSCVTDVTKLYEHLTDVLGFSSERTLVLLNEDATRANIQERLDWIAAATNPGRVFVSFSGYGTVVRPAAPAADAYYAMHRNEALLPYADPWPNLIHDDLFKAFLQKLPDSSQATILLDCAWHAAAAGDQMYGGLRYAKPPLRFQLPLRNADSLPLRAAGSKPDNTPETARVAGLIERNQRHVLVTAARAANSGRECRDSTVGGLVTSSFLRARAAYPEGSWQVLCNEMSRYAHANLGGQQIRVEGSAARLHNARAMG